MATEYKVQIEQRALKKVDEIRKRLPEFMETFFVARSLDVKPRSLLGYAQDLEIFFDYVLKKFPDYKDLSMKELPISCLERFKPKDIDAFISSLGNYEFNDKELHNGMNGKKRKLAALREMYKQFCKYEMISSNPAILATTPKIPDKDIRVLDNEEKRILLNAIMSEEKLTKRQLEAKKKVDKRDYALTLLFLGTGIRISELVGLDLQDVNFREQYIKVLGKGGRYTEHYFNDEIFNALNTYIDEQRSMYKPVDTENALFLSIYGERITVRSVEKLIQKYAERGFGFKNNISPHKLRSTYGTNLLEKTGDIDLVSENLGHRSISTTKEYYMKQSKERLRQNKTFDIF